MTNRSAGAALLAVALLSACSAGGGDKSTPTGPGGTTPVLTSVTLSGGNSINAGGTLQLTATPKDQSGNAITASVVWTTSSTFVATVNSNGLVTGVAAGQATITATSGSVSGSTIVTVTTGAFPISQVVNMPGTLFSPPNIDILVGGTVNYVFPALSHNVIFNATAGAPADIPITANATVSRTFATKGTFNFSCTVHPGMIGTVVVH
jgi:plastocyanin